MATEEPKWRSPDGSPISKKQSIFRRPETPASFGGMGVTVQSAPDTSDFLTRGTDTDNQAAGDPSREESKRRIVAEDGSVLEQKRTTEIIGNVIIGTNDVRLVDGEVHGASEKLDQLNGIIDVLVDAGYEPEKILVDRPMAARCDTKAALDWVADAFLDIKDSREKMGKSTPVLDRAERALKTIRAALTAQQQPVNAELLEACKKAAEIFRDYERIHLSKNPPDRAKAERNGEYAYVMEQAIASAEQKGGV